jgi:predicted permease
MDFHRFVREHLPPLAIAREPEIVDELAQHLSDLYQEVRARGLTHDAALARATAALPAYPDELGRAIETASRSLPGLIADRWRITLDEPAPQSAGRFTMMSDLRRDLRYALRMLLRTPGFTFVVVLTIALGVGANAAIFSAVDALLLRSAPIADPHRVVSIYTSSSDNDPFSSSSYLDYVDLRDSGTLAGLAAFATIALSMDAGGETQPVRGEVVSGNYFDVLGVPIRVGRAFRPDEDVAGNPVRVAVITHDFWLRQFAGDPSAVGKPISLNGQSYSVIGVTPRGFVGPVLGRAPELWVPLALQTEVRPPSAGVRQVLGSSNLLNVRDVRWLNMIGRLHENSGLEQASAALDVMGRRLAAASPDSNAGRKFSVVLLGEGPGVRASARPLLGLLGVAVVLVLLIACANVASLLLARAISRRREVAVRMAVGAGRSRLVRQWLTESVLLALLGAVGATVLAIWATPILYGFGIPESVELGVNVRVVLFALLVAIACGLLFGMAPIVQTFRQDSLSALRDEGGAVATGARAARMRRAFVVVQVALSLMLLVGAGLFLRTLQNARAVELGYQIENTLLVDINLDVRGYSPESGQAAYQQLMERVAAIPGVTTVGASRVTVLSGAARSGAISTDGQPVNRAAGNSMTVRSNVIAGRYLEAMGIPVVRGRNFNSSDNASARPVAIVSRSLANRLWPGADPIGKPIVAGTMPIEVVGAVPDAVYASAIERNPPPFFYVPLLQRYESGMTLHIRTAGDPLALVPSVRQAVRDVDPQLIAGRPRPLSDEFAASIGEQRTMVILIGLFGGVALLLAAVGLYGTMAHLAGQRTTEMGIRLALGARPSSIMMLVISEGLRLVGLGAALGLAGAFAGSRQLQSQLFNVAPTDPVTFVSVALVLVAVGTLACALPARRVMKLDPVVALRQ